MLNEKINKTYLFGITLIAALGGFLFGYDWVRSWEVVEMFSNRHLYPFSGFRVIVQAYGRALRQNPPLDPKEFVTGYAGDRFGLKGEEAVALWDILTADATVVYTGLPGYGEAAQKALARVNQARENREAVKRHVPPRLRDETRTCRSRTRYALGTSLWPYIAV